MNTQRLKEEGGNKQRGKLSRNSGILAKKGGEGKKYFIFAIFFCGPHFCVGHDGKKKFVVFFPGQRHFVPRIKYFRESLGFVQYCSTSIAPRFVMGWELPAVSCRPEAATEQRLLHLQCERLPCDCRVSMKAATATVLQKLQLQLLRP